MPVFIRRLSESEMKGEAEWPANTLLDVATQNVPLDTAGSSKLIALSAMCTHLGCIPIPYLGKYGGWSCICHGSIFDKRGRVRQGPAGLNLRTINSTSLEIFYVWKRK